MLLVLGLAGGLSAQAQTTPTAEPWPAGFSVSADTIYLEEEWELLVTSPDPINDGPQVETFMSLVQDTSEPYPWFMLNVRDAPGPFRPGGMQVQLWDFTDHLLDDSEYHWNQLSTPDETVTWRQRMTCPNKDNNICTFEICNGTSTTWGNFGNTYDASGNVTSSPGPQPIRFSPNACKDFSQYNPMVSVQMSRVSWEADHVGHLRLLAVRQYDANRNLLSTWDPKDFSVSTDVDLTK